MSLTSESLDIEIDGTVQQKFDMIKAYLNDEYVINHDIDLYSLASGEKEFSEHYIKAVDDKLFQFLNMNPGIITLKGSLSHGDPFCLPDEIFARMAKTVPDAYMVGSMQLSDSYNCGYSNIVLYKGKLYCLRKLYENSWYDDSEYDDSEYDDLEDDEVCVVSIYFCEYVDKDMEWESFYMDPLLGGNRYQ